MKIKYTSHSVERSLERIGLTGVELNMHIARSIVRGHIKPNRIFRDGIHNFTFKIKGQKIKLILNKNVLITVWAYPKEQ